MTANVPQLYLVVEAGPTAAARLSAILGAVRGIAAVLIKAGADVVVSVRRAMIGADLGTLRAAVEREFRAEDELARQLREAMDKLEIAFLTRLGALRHG